jgi:hypothetical protein
VNQERLKMMPSWCHLKKIHQQQVPQVLFDVCDKALGDLYEYIKRDFLLETCVP